METKKNKEITLNGEVWIKKGAEKASLVKNMEYAIVRTYSAGVFAGYIQSRHGQEVIMENARRLWYWDGAASLSELAMKGVSKPQNCKFPIEVVEITLTQAIEIIPCTEKSRLSIVGVPEWTAKK